MLFFDHVNQKEQNGVKALDIFLLHEFQKQKKIIIFKYSIKTTTINNQRYLFFNCSIAHLYISLYVELDYYKLTYKSKNCLLKFLCKKKLDYKHIQHGTQLTDTR